MISTQAVRSAFCLLLVFATTTTVLFSQTGTLPLPPRPAGAMTGTQFYNTINGLTDEQREQEIVNQVAIGNVPDFIRTLVPVTVTATVGGSQHSVTYFVTPDYIAIGSDADYFRMPMSAPLAQQIVDILDCHLPTRKMVNDIWTASSVKLTPFAFNPSQYDIDSVPVFWQHNQAVENQLGSQTPGALVGGHKKDVVVTPQLLQRPPPERVAIYGWHYPNGSHIQPLSLVHVYFYEDYSHGIRAVEEIVLLDGQPSTVSAILADPNLAGLLSDEGAFTNEYPVPNPYPLPNTAPELVTGGGFEGTFAGGVGDGWTSWTAPGSAAITFGRASLNKYEGSHSQYWARGNTTPFEGGVLQTIGVTPGAACQITAWLKRQSTFSGTTLEFGYDLTGGTDPASSNVIYTDLTGNPDNTWVQYDQTVTATGSSITLFARAGHTGSTGGSSAYFYLDAVSAKETSPAPFVVEVSNPGFEDGFTGGVGNDWNNWTSSGSATVAFGQASFNKHEGSHSQYWARTDTAAFDAAVYQTIVVENGKSYDVSGWMKRQSVLAGTFLQFGYDATGGTDPEASSVTYIDLSSSPDNTWAEAATTFTANGSLATLFARAGHTGTTGGPNAYFYFDDVTIAETVTPPVTEVVVDNDNGAPGYAETGTWYTSSSSGYNNGSYRWTGIGSSNTATWNLDAPATGTWKVEVMYRAGTNRASSSRYSVDTASGTQTVFVNQQNDNLTWVELGTWTFTGGQGSVTLDAGGSSGGSVVIADAVRLSWVP